MPIEYETIPKDIPAYLTIDELQEMIATCAYFKAEKRGFSVSNAIEDWLAAEQEITRHCFYWCQED